MRTGPRSSSPILTTSSVHCGLNAPRLLETVYPNRGQTFILTFCRHNLPKREDTLGIRREMTLWEAGHVSIANSSEWKMAVAALLLLKFVL